MKYTVMSHIKPYHEMIKKLDEISGDGLIIDVGGGNEPYHKASIIVDKFPGETVHRGGGKPIVVPTGVQFIQGDIQSLPFESGSVDFIFSRHTLEHTDNPQQALKELFRVGKKGYIQVPTVMWEQFFSRPMYHHWKISWRDEYRDSAYGKPFTGFVFEENDTNPLFTHFMDDLFAYNPWFQQEFWENYELFLHCVLWEHDENG